METKQQMKPEAQRIAIAEACPSVFLIRPGSFSKKFTYWNCDGEQGQSVDPLNDLNAMHEAEKVLKEAQRVDWFWQMCRVIGIPQTSLHAYDLAHATAAQRAEAFLRTIGKWEDK